MAIYSIYRLTNLVNGKVYIGKTKRKPKLRLKEHLDDSAKGSPFLIHQAIRKYGIDSFRFEVIFQTTAYEFLTDLETHFITEHQSCILDTPDHGYNMTNGGDGWDPEWVRQWNLKKVADGVHQFQGERGSELSKKTNAIRKENGTHNWTSEFCREREFEKMRNGVHPFGSENTTKWNTQRLANGSHNFQGEAGSKLQREKLQNGVHHSQILHTCPHCGMSKSGNRFKGTHFDKCRIIRQPS